MNLGKGLTAVRMVAPRLRVLIGSGVLAVMNRGHANGFL